jgi:hypothetical protein
MKNAKAVEYKCSDGIGLPAVTKPVQPGRRIYPVPCQQCAGKAERKRPPTEAALLPQAVAVPCVLNLKDDDRHDGRHQDRSGQYSH